jgi:hypothetical protein
MKTTHLLSALALATLIFTGCGDAKQPTLSDALKGSYKIQNGMTLDEVSKIMQIEPTGQEKIGDNVIWKYEGDIEKGEDETKKVTYNNIIIKFNKGKVVHSGTFSCNIPQPKED